MIHPSRVVSIHPYFRAKPGKMAEAKAMLPRFIARTATETRNLYYDFTISGEEIFCREAYEGAEGLLEHLKNVEQILGEYLTLVDIIRVELHGSAEELAKLREPLAGLKPQWFEFQDGVVRK